MEESKRAITRHTWYLITALLLITAGCAPVYVANTRHTHLLDQKGEVSAGAYAGTNGADIQGAYAVSDHWGVLGAASFAKQKTDNEDQGSLDPDYHKHCYGELGVTYFRKIGRMGRLEGLGGFGLGKAEAVDNYKIFNDQKLKATGSYNKIFLQGNIGLETGALEAGLALRLSQVTFSKFEVNKASYDHGSESGTFFEPAAFARLGWKPVKLELQLGFNAPLQDDLRYDYDPFFTSIGLVFNLNTRP